MLGLVVMAAMLLATGRSATGFQAGELFFVGLPGPLCYGPRMPHATETAPTLWQALKRGLAGKCPACGEAKLFGRFLKPVSSCASCGRDWTVQRADDFPAYLVVLVLGHLLIPIVVEVNLSWDLSLGVQMLLWPAIALVGTLAMIQPAKGFVIALIWAR
jgi:uncharacterized protein (DUF983 family)